MALSLTINRPLLPLSDNNLRPQQPHFRFQFQPNLIKLPNPSAGIRCSSSIFNDKTLISLTKTTTTPNNNPFASHASQYPPGTYSLFISLSHYYNAFSLIYSIIIIFISTLLISLSQPLLHLRISFSYQSAATLYSIETNFSTTFPSLKGFPAFLFFTTCVLHFQFCS